MLIPPFPSGAPAWSCSWTGTGARWLLDAIRGSTGDSLSVAALVAEPVFDDADEVTEGALSAIELAESAPPSYGITAPGYERATAYMSGLLPADGYGPAKALLDDDLRFGHNTSGTDWPDVTHLAVLDGDDTVLAIVGLATSVSVAPTYTLRIPASSMALLIATGPQDA